MFIQINPLDHILLPNLKNRKHIGSRTDRSFGCFRQQVRTSCKAREISLEAAGNDSVTSCTAILCIGGSTAHKIKVPGSGRDRPSQPAPSALRRGIGFPRSLPRRGSSRWTTRCPAGQTDNSGHARSMKLRGAVPQKPIDRLGSCVSRREERQSRRDRLPRRG
jgi:hypothetical protein